MTFRYCAQCGAFTADHKEVHTKCRCCGAPRPMTTVRQRWMNAIQELEEAWTEAKKHDCHHKAVARNLTFCPDCGKEVPL